MLKHGEGGHFVTTASMGGLLPGVNAGVYTSTKIAAVGIMEALRVELESTNVGTSVFCPGLVSTDNYPMGEENPFRAAQMAKSGMPARPQMPNVGMDPLEAGERVLNGVLNNDLFILSPGARGCHHGFDTDGGNAYSAGSDRRRARRHEMRHLCAGDRASQGEAQELSRRVRSL